MFNPRFRGRYQGRPNSFQGRGNGNFRRARKSPVYDPQLFIQKATTEAVQEYQPRHTFADFHLNPQILANFAAKGYTAPTPIQDQAIPALLEGKDVVGIANTGTGKTAAFLAPLIDKIIKNRAEKVLIITPTRELAVQVEQDFRDLARGMNINSVVCIGGVGIGGQIQRLRTNPAVVVGTPGRLKDLENQRKINFVWFRSVVLDEVDRMLDMGFIKDVTYIVSRLPRPRQSLFFSATLPDRVRTVMQQFATNPVTISVQTGPTAKNVDQDVIKMNGRDKIAVLDELLNNREYQRVLVFGRTKRGIDRISRELADRRVSVAAIHGNKSQSQRQRALEQFKAGRVQVLLATDIASRGLDISGVTHVINYDLPETYEDYVHRIGRTGRANHKGCAITFMD